MTRIWPAVAVVSCALGMGSKEAMVTAPVAVLLFDRVFLFPSLREALRVRWRLYAALASTWTILAVLLATGPRPFSAGFSAGVSAATYLLNQPPLIVRYLGQTLWPRSLVAVYGWPTPPSLPDVLPCAALLLALLGLTLWALRGWPAAGFLGAWFFLTLSPASSFVPVATEVGAERRMYLPLIALIVLGVLAGLAVCDRVGPVLARRVRVSGGIAAMLLAAVSTALAAATVDRNREYRSEVDLVRITLARYPTPVGHHVLAEALLARGDRAEAMTHLRLAVPGDPRAHYTLGVELFKQGQLQEAALHLRTFLEKQPRLVYARGAHGFLGAIYGAQENWPAAIEQFQALLQLDPDNPDAQRSLADALSGAARFADAIPMYRAYLQARPLDVDALNQLGLALASVEQLPDAADVFARAAAIDPSNGAVQHNTALVLLEIGDVDRALVHAEQAAALQPDDAATRELLEFLRTEQRRGTPGSNRTR